MGRRACFPCAAPPKADSDCHWVEGRLLLVSPKPGRDRPPQLLRLCLIHVFSLYLFNIPVTGPTRGGWGQIGGTGRKRKYPQDGPQSQWRETEREKKVFRYYWTSSRPERVFCPVVSSLIRKLTMVPLCPFSPPAPFFSFLSRQHRASELPKFGRGRRERKGWR